jgi:NADPH:quinone reductase-like Zn-dependent oxidoreductase
LIAHRAGIAVSRNYPELDWRRQLVKQLESHQVNVVLDVGANSAQYATGLRQAAFNGRIVSFKRLSGLFYRFGNKASRDPLWDCRQLH